ncbi:MAG: N-acetyltransferase [Bacteroides sp.]|nr:N-acetyltransferase [Bacteroides sp.]
MKVIIKEVTTRKDLKRFVVFPNKLYQGNAFYVPPLISGELETLSRTKNPAFEFCEIRYWLACDENDRILGRIAGIINPVYNEKTGTSFMRFGWLDFIEDEYVLKALMQTVENWAIEKNLKYTHGPLGMTDFDVSGILVEGFEEIPTVYGKYNFPYYGPMIEKLGYEKEVDWLEFNVKVPKALPEKYIKMANIIQERHNLHSIRFKSKKELLQHLDEIFALLNKEYDSIHGFSQLSVGQIESLKKQFVPIIRLDLISVVKNTNNKIVGFGFALPSLSKALQKGKGKLFPFGIFHIQKALKRNDTLDSLLIAVDSDYKDKGVNALIFYDIGNASIESGITNVETTRELEENHKVQNLWHRFEFRQHKRARCFVKKL